MPDPLCKHERKRLIAKDDDSQYWECLDCGEILEAGELPANSSPVSPAGSSVEKEKSVSSGESLSDA
jgi:hypothetical protein